MKGTCWPISLEETIMKAGSSLLACIFAIAACGLVGCASDTTEESAGEQNVTAAPNGTGKLNAVDSKKLIDLLEKGGVPSQNGVAGPSFNAHASCDKVNGANASCSFDSGKK